MKGTLLSRSIPRHAVSAGLLTCLLLNACGVIPPNHNLNPAKESLLDTPPSDPSYIEEYDIKVPQNRVRAGLGTIQLRVVRFRPPPSTPSIRPPIVYLTGGPGGSIKRSVESLAQTGAGVRLAENWKRDILFVTQRGTEGSKPFLRCANDTFCSKDKNGIKLDLQEYRKAGIDLASFNTIENAADIADVSKALGYKQIVLYGHSYGTMLAQAVMQRHPSLVHSAILSGFLYKPRRVLYYDRSTEELSKAQEDALAWYADICKGDTTCSQKAPAWDPRVDYQTVSTFLAKKPLQVEEQAWTADLFQGKFAENMKQAPDGTFSFFAVMRTLAAGQSEKASKLIQFAKRPVSSNSTEQKEEEDSSFADLMFSFVDYFDAKQFVKSSSSSTDERDREFYRKIVPPQPDYSPEQFSAPFVSTGIPTLFLVGGLDRQTPAAWAREDHKKFTPFQYVEFPCANHSSSGELQPSPRRSLACGASLVASFLQDPEKPVDTSCVKPTCDAVATQFAVDFSNALQLMSVWP